MNDFQNTPGHMLPTTLNSGPSAETRTDAQIRVERDASAGLERGTTRDAKGNIVNIRAFPKPVPESYQAYLNRTEGLVDFKPLSEIEWSKETNQLLNGQIINVTEVTSKMEYDRWSDKAFVNAELKRNSSTPTPGVGMSPVEPIFEAEELLGIPQEPAMEVEELIGDWENTTVPDVVYPAKISTPVLDHLPEGSH